MTDRPEPMGCAQACLHCKKIAFIGPDTKEKGCPACGGELYPDVFMLHHGLMVSIEKLGGPLVPKKSETLRAERDALRDRIYRARSILRGSGDD